MCHPPLKVLEIHSREENMRFLPTGISIFSEGDRYYKQISILILELHRKIHHGPKPKI